MNEKNVNLERRITVIPARPQAQSNLPMRQKRVAAYCRVSTDEEEQLSSYEAQCNYYTEKILSNREWTMAGIFADEGITGTSAKKRPEFLRMIRMCKQGKIDFILVKSISRFARNTVDCLNYIRLLRGLGIGIYFEKENINTLDADTEIIITFMGAFAQAESESISKNVTWGKRQAMREGKTYLQYKYLYGYRKGEDGKPEIIPEQAEVVREIYKRYLAGDSFRMIRDWLNQRGIPYMDGRQWSHAHVVSILTSEKYRGDVLMQKSYVEDCISKKIVKNNGELPMYLVENNHPAIVSRELSNAVLAEMARRRTLKTPSTKTKNSGTPHYSGKYALTERLICGECGTRYRRCTWTAYGEKRYVWRCTNRLDHGKKYCHKSPTMREDYLQEAILKALNATMAGKDTMVSTILDEAQMDAIVLPGTQMSMTDIQQRLESLEMEFGELLAKAADEGTEEYTDRFREITKEVTKLKLQQEQLAQHLLRNTPDALWLEKVKLKLAEAETQPGEAKWREDTIRQLVHTVLVLSKDRIRVYLTDGRVIEQEVRTQ